MKVSLNFVWLLCVISWVRSFSKKLIILGGSIHVVDISRPNGLINIIGSGRGIGFGAVGLGG